MSTEATSNNRDAVATAQPPAVAKEAPTEQQQSQPGVPKKFAPGQTVCNVKNEKGKLCNGHLKQTHTGGEEALKHLRGDDVLSKCQSCGALYVGPPLGHLRDPDKQQRFIEKDLTAILRAAGGTLPFYPTTPTQSAPASKAKTAAPAKALPTTTSAASANAASAVPASGAIAAAATETPEEKRRRLGRVVAEAKQRAGKPLTPEQEELLRTAPSPAPVAASPVASPVAATPRAASSASADAHRPAAEAQAATGQASAAPMSPAAATASPAAGAETVADLAPEASTELTPGAPRAATPKQAASSSGGIPPPPPHLAPPPGETHEEKIARLRLVVAEAKARAGKE